MERRDFFTVVAIGLAAWASLTLLFRNAQTEVVERVIDQVPILPKFEEPNAFTVRADRSSIVVVCDAHGQQIGKWFANEGKALLEKGWRIQTIDLEGSTEFRFYVFERGTWKIHNGHLSLATLTSLLSRTTPPQQPPKTGSPSAAGGMIN